MTTLTVDGRLLGRVMDSIGRVCSEALGRDKYVFAAGGTQDVTDADEMVVPIEDDFAEQEMPIITLALGKWEPQLKPGQERLHIEVKGAIWRSRVPLGENVAGLYDDRDRLADALIAHAYAFGHESSLQSAVLMGGPGIKARAIPRRGAGADTALFITLPFTVDAVLLRTVTPLPA